MDECFSGDYATKVQRTARKERGDLSLTVRFWGYLRREKMRLITKSTGEKLFFTASQAKKLTSSNLEEMIERASLMPSEEAGQVTRVA